jgi:transglutaminase superfamily protein
MAREARKAPTIVKCVEPVTPSADANLTAWDRGRIAAEIVTTYVRVRWWLIRLDFPHAVAAARDVSLAAERAGDGTEVALRLGHLVQRALRALPFDGRCLIRSLVLTRMLARRGIEATLVLGVRAKPEFAAHAWLERDGIAILPTWPEFERLAEY